jgi:hypothetical protein
MHLTVEVRRQKDSLRSIQSKATTAATNPPQFLWHRAYTHARTGTHTPESATTTAPPPIHDHSSGNTSPRPPRSGTRINALTATPTTLGTLYITIYGTPSTAIRPTASYGPWWTAPGLACTAQSMPSPPAHTKTKPPRVLTPTCTHESTPSPPHRTPTLAAANSFPSPPIHSPY